MALDMSMKEKIEMIPLIEDAIYCSNIDKMKSYLRTLISPQDDPKIQLAWMDIFISKIYEHNEKDLVQPFFDELDDINFISELKSVCFYIMKGVIEKELLHFIGDSLKKESYRSIIENISVYEESEYTRHGCENARIMFGEVSYRENLQLDLFNEKDPATANSKVREFLNEQLDKKETFRGIPKWLIKKSPDIALSELFYENISIPSPNKINELYQILYKEGIIGEKFNLETFSQRSITKMNDFFISQYSMLLLVEKFDIFQALSKLDSKETFLKSQTESYSTFIDEKNLNIDLEFFRIYGPVNTTYDQPISSDSFERCSEKGGCRMLDCVCFNYDYEIEEHLDYETNDREWFKENCEKCHRKIGKRNQNFEQRKRCALREPLAYGSWRGCFCSFGCIYSSIVERYEDAEETSTKDIQKMLLLTMEAQIKAIGIYF